jgi:hypothetical protein
MVGYVYAFETPSVPGVVKIGATNRDPVERLREASRTWHEPDAYRIVWAVRVEDPFASERAIHALLAARRIHRNRELFRLTTEEARQVAMVLELLAWPLAVDSESVPAVETPRDDTVSESYDALKANFELTRFKTENCKSPFHSIDEETGDITSRTKEAFKVAYTDWIPVGGRQFLDRWLNDGLKRFYRRIEYGCVKKEDQESTVSTVYYAFPEMRHETLVSISTENEKQANVDYFLDYVKLLVEDRPEYVEWMAMWLADILVNPHDKGNQPVAVVLWGEQGAGKTCLRELMAHLLGARLVHHTDDPFKNGDIMHDFNSTLKYKLFIEFEEINFKTHGKVAEIKRLITGHTHTITHRGQDSVDVKATERALFTTNAAGSMVVERTDKRYAAFAVSSRRVGDTAYWTAHYAKLKDQSYVKDVAEYLLSRKDALATYALQNKRPITDYYRSLQQLTISPELDFLRASFLFGAATDLVEFATCPERYAIPSSMLAARYNAWRVSNGIRGPVTCKGFTMKMASLGSNYGITQERTSRSNNFAIDVPRLCASIRRDFNIEAA